MSDVNTPVIVDFPLRGEWMSPNTPGTRVPSHGTNRFGTRYAYDFLQVDWTRRGHPNYRVYWLSYLLFGVSLSKCYCWGKDIYAACAHLKYGSVKVRIGQKVKKGDLLGCIGHSGNSFFPHLHFQLMDSDDMCSAKGIPCAFANYEVFKNGEWETITNGIPTDKDRIRF